MLVKRDRVRACRLQRPRGINSGREDWRSAGLPDDMILIPGVIDSVTNFVEPPRRVAQRIAVIDHGRIVAMGSSQELKQRTNTESLEEAFLTMTEGGSDNAPH